MHHALSGCRYSVHTVDNPSVKHSGPLEIVSYWQECKLTSSGQGNGGFRGLNESARQSLAIVRGLE